MKSYTGFTAMDGTYFDSYEDCAKYEYKCCINWSDLNSLGIRLIIIRNGVDMTIKDLRDCALEELYKDSETFNVFIIRILTPANIVKGHYKGEACYLYVPTSKSIEYLKQIMCEDSHFSLINLHKGLNELNNDSNGFGFKSSEETENRVCHNITDNIYTQIYREIK